MDYAGPHAPRTRVGSVAQSNWSNCILWKVTHCSGHPQRGPHKVRPDRQDIRLSASAPPLCAHLTLRRTWCTRARATGTRDARRDRIATVWGSRVTCLTVLRSVVPGVPGSLLFVYLRSTFYMLFCVLVLLFGRNTMVRLCACGTEFLNLFT